MENKMLELLKTRRSVRAYKPEQIQARSWTLCWRRAPMPPPAWGCSPR